MENPSEGEEEVIKSNGVRQVASSSRSRSRSCTVTCNKNGKTIYRRRRQWVGAAEEKEVEDGFLSTTVLRNGLGEQKWAMMARYRLFELSHRRSLMAGLVVLFVVLLVVCS